MLETILCATDFSPTASRAALVATAWAERSQGSLELLHVIEAPIATYPVPTAWLTADVFAMLEQDLRGRMEDELAKLRARVKGVRGSMAHGVPHTEIVRAAEKARASLIVLGTEGGGAIARALLGSVADRVLRSSTTPVLLVPSDARDVSVIPRVIVAPTDLSSHAKVAVDRTVSLARRFGARVELVHAYDIPASFAHDAALTRTALPALEAELRDFHALGGAADVTVHVREGAPAAIIAAICRETNADLVAMASSGRGMVSSLLLGGVTDRVVRTSDVPVLVLRSA